MRGQQERRRRLAGAGASGNLRRLDARAGECSGRKRNRSCATPGYDPARLPPGPVPDREVAGPARRLGSDNRPRDVDVPRLRRGRAARSSSRGSSSPRCPGTRRRRTSTASPAGRASTRPSRASTGGRSPSSSRRSRRARFVVAHAEHDFTSNVPLSYVDRRRRAARARGRRRAADGRARLAAAPGRPGQVLLEERQVAARTRAARPRPAGLLGALRLPQRRRSLARAALRLLAALGGIPRSRDNWTGGGGR